MPSQGDREFGQEEKLVPGTILGFRSWKVSIDMDLMPVNPFPQAWVPGINEAMCWVGKGLGYGPWRYAATNRPTNEHKPNKKCHCGFYAYTQDPLESSQYRDGNMCGIIEAWGTCVVGEKGFRAQYAVIRALCQSALSTPGNCQCMEPSL
jgi:hypothetical protein